MVILYNISVSFNGNAVLRNVSLCIQDGEFAYIIGPSGAGKTTLLRTIYLDVIPDKGIVQVGDFNSLSIKRKQIPLLRQKIGNVFQDFKLLDDRSAFDNVAFALRVTGAPAKRAKKKTLRALTAVGLLSKRDCMPRHLSGGELQRACIARAMALDPMIILADEPTGNLDPDTAREIFILLKKINKQGTAVLTATHNYRIIEEFPGRVFRIENGAPVEYGTA